MTSFQGSSYRRKLDVETGSFISDGNDDEDGPFCIPNPKKASPNQLRRWRQATLVLNAHRRFRYKLDLDKEKQKELTLTKIRDEAENETIVTYDAKLKIFKVDIEQLIEPPKTTPEGYKIGQKQLVSVTKDSDFPAMERYGGVEGLAKLLETNVEKGIVGDDEDLRKRKKAFGSNTYPRKRRSFLTFLWEAFQDKALITSLVAAFLSMLLGMIMKTKEGLYDVASIVLANYLYIHVTAIIDYVQYLQFQKSNEEIRNIHVQVIRGGRRIEVSIYDIVVGDVVPLNVGNHVPADGVLISCHHLAIDESRLTGEEEIVSKGCGDPFLMSGGKVVRGSGIMMVTSVGVNTEWGLFMTRIPEDTGEETPLLVHINGIATFIGKVGLIVAFFVLVALVVRYVAVYMSANPEFKEVDAMGKGFKIAGSFFKIVAIAVILVAVIVPEGLPLAVPLTLAYTMRKMKADKVLVRRFSAIEMMGSVQTICTDKTGILTLNQMTVVEGYAAGKKVDPHSRSELSPLVSSLLIEGIANNTHGGVFVPESGGETEVFGSPTEKAILSWGIQLGMNFEAARLELSLLHVFPFDSEKKWSAVAAKPSHAEVHVHWKGAAEVMLSLCSHYIDDTDHVVAMDENKMKFFKKAIEDMATRSLRCVAIAYRMYDLESLPTDDELKSLAPDDDLILLAIVGIKDPCRPGVKNAVELCQRAGVKVHMVTGDNLQTAKAIGLECGILDDADAAFPYLIEGKVFRALSDDERDNMAENIMVMACSSPEDKLLFVQALRRRGLIVAAVSGDGTNDTPVLREADIGLAMGIQGNEAAKEGSDIVILDDNFASVVKAVRWGRSMCANVQNIIQFRLTVLVAALIIYTLAAFISSNFLVYAEQLLWFNFVIDTTGALALASEPPTDQVMHSPPVGRKAPLVTNVMLRNLLVQACYQIIALPLLYYRGESLLKLEDAQVRSMLMLNTFVLCQIFNLFNVRRPEKFNIFEGITKHFLFNTMVTITICLQVGFIFFVGIFTPRVLNWKHWCASIAIGFVSLPLAAVGKLIPVDHFNLSFWRQ